ncbi:membrane protein [Mesorhizobium sp. LSJC268A00]|jgi:outer membrane lipoprotein-sorting protein|uniref:outer-membrane lipoprotein carrier protein LolA n=1 Tax=unclassified Mesorhizobium TaxID=325217 RepID=UPI0003CE5DD2|nr:MULTISPECIES: outer membrane lipoprotein carrier protein LolA [unclassified Mesorhizobium]ESW66363.1 membrane protein [Mesorhizobium sp. LSJC277A00]ESW95316.1 membrane protein [Mesorhizobium sp. LSJC268A00]ESX07562.1 membrane protein [Mesorhizobium sp. LSJC265A00]ESX50885.1 membrane protein [Mesorhizobium sp. LSHC426A00]ESX54012.1 membrane protein [Mesorhizobium sp. LSHC424B00]
MKNDLSAISDFAPNRRQLLGLGLMLAGAAAINVVPGFQLLASAQAAVPPTAQKIADHFSSVKSMSGEFVQFGPNNQQTGGKFFLERPGKIRFNYDGKSNFRVISDGKSVVILNKRLKTSDLYPLSKTPLKLLLDTKIDLSGGRVKSIKEESDLTTIQLADKSVFGNSKITMMFDPKSYDLRQWTITDAQGKDTTVMIYNTKEGVSFPADTFAIDYTANRELNTNHR